MKKFFMIFLFAFFVFVIPLNASEKIIYEKNEFIIKLEKNYKYDVNLKNKIEETLNNKIVKSTKITIGNDIFYSIKLKNTINNINNLVKIADFTKVDKVQPMFIYTPNNLDEIKVNSIFKPKGIVEDMPWHINIINANTFKSLIVDESDKTNWVKVGVIDTGIDNTHIDLDNGVVDCSYSYNACNDTDGHGTHVAGTIGAENYYSVGKNIKLVSLNALRGGGGTSLDIVNAIEYASANNIKILNASFGVTSPLLNEKDYIEILNKDDLMYSALKQYDGLVIAAAGNESVNRSSLPAGYSLDNIISVGASTITNTKASYSNYHKTKVDVFAPGGDSVNGIFSSCSPSLDGGITVCAEKNHRTELAGTSMATPMVTGVLATLLSKDPSLTPSELKDGLIDSVTYNTYFKDYALTSGIMNAQSLYYTVFNETNAKLDKITGTIKLWGNNNYGKLGNNNNVVVAEENAFVPSVNNEKIIKYYINENNVYLITELGNLYVSGSNSFGQLGQTNSNNSMTFVKFILPNSKEVSSLSFRDLNGKKDINSIKINLKGSKDYYRLGNNSYVAGSNNYAKAYGLQFIKHENGYIDKIYYYNKNTYSNPKIETYVYNKYYESGKIKYYELSKRVLRSSNNLLLNTLYYNDDYTGIYQNVGLNICSEDYYKFDEYTYYSTKYKKSSLLFDVNCTYSTNSGGVTLVKRTLENQRLTQYDNYTKKRKTLYIKNMSSSNLVLDKKKYAYQSDGITKTRAISYTYTKGVTTKRSEWVYNSKGVLKTNSFGKAYKYVTYYKYGKKSVSYKFHYNSKGKIYKSIKLNTHPKDFNVGL